ncbi:MAG: hypothetical protein HYT48_01330 [Candidatus Vogelbacteria bacterium]|nr:hypothetical protein [Candidatus Vogelbacteria bacterium]
MKLEEELYDPNRPPAPLRRSHLSAPDENTKRGWSQAGLKAEHYFTTRWLKRLLAVGVIFFVVVVAGAFVVLRTGSNIVSSGNVELTITGPSMAAAGAPVDFQISVTNKNNSPLNFVTLTLNYPKGSISAVDPKTNLTRERISLGTIAPGETVNRAHRAVLFGESSSALEIQISTEYRLADSNAIFSQEKIYSVNINSAPLSLDLKLPSEVNAGQDWSMIVEVTSNSQTAIDGAIVQIDYPSGFTVVKTSPPPARGDDIWSLGTIEPGQKKTITVSGRLLGQAEDQKSVRVSVGTASQNNSDNLDVVYASVAKIVTIKRPYVSLTTSINGDSEEADYVGGSGQVFRTEVFWANNLPEKLYDGEILVTFIGSTLDQASVEARDGFYQSLSNTILWNKQKQSELGTIEAGASGKVTFEFSTIPLGGAGAIKNPTINLRIKFKAKRPTAGSAVEPILAEASRQIKLTSLVQLATKGLYSSGLLPGSGPMPPVVGQETIYTIVWSVINSSNDLVGTKVRAILPPAVRFVGNQAPAGESLVTNPDPSGGGEVIWELGTLRAGTGLSSAAREVAFQVGLTPSLSQADQTVELVGPATFEATDSSTGQKIELTTKRAVDTFLGADPLFKRGDETVKNP